MSHTEPTDKVMQALKETHSEYIANVVANQGQNYADAMDTMVAVLGFKTALGIFYDRSQAPAQVKEDLDGLIGAFTDMMLNRYLEALGFVPEDGTNILKSAQHMVEQLEKVASAEARAAAIVV